MPESGGRRLPHPAQRAGGRDRQPGRRRDQQGTDTGRRWVAPSANIPTVTTAQVYAGLCYFEGSNLSPGRGTTQPFEIGGAPYLDERWSIALNAMSLGSR